MKKKYLIVVPDGVGDYPLEDHGNQTILELADTPNLDWFAGRGIVGECQTVPEGMAPGSDVANMSILGFDPLKCYSGRAPLEALSLDVNLKEDELAFRMNLVIVEDGKMKDYSGHHITTEEAKPYIELLQKHLQDDDNKFYLGTSYRHIYTISKVKALEIVNQIKTTPPHDISGKEVAPNLPEGILADHFRMIMKKTAEIFEKYRDQLPGKVTQGWLWGQGTKPQFEDFMEMTGQRGAIISAVDLLKGISVAGNMKFLPVEGITGFIDTNYKGKITTAIEALKKDVDLVYVHIEAPDESGHVGNFDYKKQSIEDIDRIVIAAVRKAVEEGIEVNLLVMPDHYTPLALMTHTSDPVPFLISRQDGKLRNDLTFTETCGKKSDYKFSSGPELLQFFIS